LETAVSVAVSANKPTTLCFTAYLCDRRSRQMQRFLSGMRQFVESALHL
jgi:hypothetical protein